jgi:hypothetical protein
MRSPLQVVEKPARMVLVDADGTEIAEQLCCDWHGVAAANQLGVVRRNFMELAKAVNFAAIPPAAPSNDVHLRDVA